MHLKSLTILVTLCLSAVGLLAQPATNYDSKWKLIDSLINKKGLTQSAQEEVDRVYALAKKERNEPQQIKALVYRANLTVRTTDNGEVAAIQQLEKATAEVSQPAKSILQNILAGQYWSYLQHNRYRLQDRTNTTEPVKGDIAAWTMDDLHKKIRSLYLASLKDERLLQQRRLDDYDPIITKGNVRHLRPTLFDLLAHTALNYFISGEEDLNKPEKVFEIDDPAAFAGAAEFASHSFATSDSSSLSYYALLLYQRLLRLHLSDTRPDALLDVDIQRLEYVRSTATLEDKDNLYNAALTRLTDKWGNIPAAAEAWYLQAQLYANKAGQYQPPTDTAGRYDYLKATAICEKVIDQQDSSEGKVHCAQLLQQIMTKTLQLNIETINLPDQPFRSLVTWRNFSRLYYRLVRIDHTILKGLGNAYDDGYWQRLLKLPVLRALSIPLPATGDYQTHRTEIRIDALPAGEYSLIASDDSSFNPDKYSKHPLGVIHFYVSSISFVNLNRDYFVLDAKEGQPLARATVQIWDKNYDSRSGKQILNRAESYTTDEHGHFLLQQNKDVTSPRPIAAEITAGKDHLFLDIVSAGIFYMPSATSDENNEREQFERDHRSAFFFTDRSIYRPGQTLYFKGISVTRDFITRQYKPLTQAPTVVFLYDANGSKVDSLQLTTNEFGSYHGKFNIPEHLLNGEFALADASTGSRYEFSVEEYKRPRFYVGYDTPKVNYRVGDSIHIEGYAKAYAGNWIDGATVKFRVVRQVHYSYPCRGCIPVQSVGAPWGGYTPVRRRMQVDEIAHGIAKTDGNGRFRISFIAAPDKSINKETDPVFEYVVSADVADINGETRSGEAFVRAAYKSLQLTISQPSGDHLPADSLKTLTVQATSLSGITQTVSAEIAIYALKTPDRLIRERYWTAPDQFVLTGEEYLRSFPNDEYSDETNVEKWERKDKVWTAAESTGKTAPVAKHLSPGWYVVEASVKDSYGQTVKAVRYIELFDGATDSPGQPEYNWKLGNEATATPGEKVVVNSGSSASDVFVIRTLQRDLTIDGLAIPGKRSDSASFSYFTMAKGRRSSEFEIKESDRGGFGISEIFVKDNRVYTRLYTVHVPWTNKELSINYTTWRDKVLPGSEEKWQVTIKGEKQDKVTAEVLAGMYDASLDQFKPQKWSYLAYPTFESRPDWNDCLSEENSTERYIWSRNTLQLNKLYDELLHPNSNTRIQIRGAASFASPAPRAMAFKSESGLSHTISIPDNDADPDGSKGLTKDQVVIDEDKALPPTPNTPVQVRQNFNETAFFFPDLRTDSSGSVTFSFTLPEALTSWKWMTLAHTKDLAFGYSEKTIVTQKQLMVQPNTPRFLREGDHMDLPIKVVNLTDSEMTGQVALQLTDPTTGQTADGWFTNRQPNQYFTVGPRQSTVISFPLVVPFQYNRPLSYKVTAQSRDYSDGEEAILPVVSNRMLVTETLPLDMKGDGTRQFKFEKLLHSGSSETLNNHALTVEFTANPVWYAIQSLPYLTEYPYECAEQTFNRWYANALASRIVAVSPRLKDIFQRWKTQDTAALLSNLQKNQELKSVLLEETPWVLQGKTEEQQKKNVAILFDMTRMSTELGATFDKLKAMQSPDGGFSWFKGGTNDLYITQYILTGIGHLQQLNAIPESAAPGVTQLVKQALTYVDDQMKRQYESIRKEEGKPRPLPPGTPRPLASGKTITPWIGELPVQYLYMRSFFNDYGIPGNILPAVSYFRKQVQSSWVDRSKYMQGMIALALFRTGDVQTAKEIIKSLKQTAIVDEQGMYWKGMEGGYYWYEAPIEIQSLLIEAFREISADKVADRDLKTWLLKQKQTHSWRTTKATADACYALLVGGTSWMNDERKVSITLGEKVVASGAAEQPAGEAGTGYFKKVFDAPFVNPSMGNITVTMSSGTTTGTTTGAGSTSPAWGAVYWQYFDLLDKITPPGNSKMPLSLTKQLFIERLTSSGRVLDPVPANGVLKPGDKVIVRIQLKADRSMEYVHMKDMRAACMEPVNVISQYKWQGGLGYYESTKDASTDFFFSSLSKGTYVFEYPLTVGQAGNFSNGITSIECMYAPEFSYHSEGIRVSVEPAP